jgi:hypothetical protein
VVTNNGTGVQPDNAGVEFIDAVPLTLAMGTPTATSGSTTPTGANEQEEWTATIRSSGPRDRQLTGWTNPG